MVFRQKFTAYDHIRSNTVKTWFLIFCFPAVFGGLVSGAIYLMIFADNDLWDLDPISKTELIHNAFIYIILPIILFTFLWALLSYFTGDKMIRYFAGAQKLDRKNPDYKRIYHAVEHVAIAAGLPCPDVYVIDDDSLNAFAAGHSPKSASITLTTGIIKHLNHLELEGVIAHEMGHIGNRDVRLNMIIIAGIGACDLIGASLLRTAHLGSGRSSRGKNPAGAFYLLGGAFLIFSALFAPLIHLAISRSREYAADATGALITRNPAALASALEKISKDARVEALDSTKAMAHICISDPGRSYEPRFFGSTHPPVKERIRRLRHMAGEA